MLRIYSPQMGFFPQYGGGRYDYEQLLHLIRAGHRVASLIPRRNESASIIPEGLEYRSIHARSFFHPYTWSLPFLLPSLGLIRSFKPDVIRIHSPYYLGLLGIALKKLCSVPTYACMLHFEFDQGPFARVENRLLSAFDGISCISQATLADFQRRYPNYTGLTSRIYCGVDEMYLPGDCDRQKAGLDGFCASDEGYFLFTGNHISRKNLHWLLELFSEFCKLEPRGKLVICGSGPLTPELQRRAQLPDIQGRVLLPGRVSDVQKLNLMRGARAFLLPSLMEGFGLAAAEAMRCGVPAIMSNFGSLPELLQPGRSGWALPLDFSAWLPLMQRLIQDLSFARASGELAAQFVTASFSWEKNALQTAEFCRELVTRSRAPKLSS
jgi:glycosyltransferase involved in cell wall biosynthesis